MRKATKEEIRKVQYQLSQMNNDPNLKITTSIDFFTPKEREEIKEFEIRAEKEKHKDYWKEWEK